MNNLNLIDALIMYLICFKLFKIIKVFLFKIHSKNSLHPSPTFLISWQTFPLSLPQGEGEDDRTWR